MSEREAIKRALEGESISSLATEYGMNRSKLQTMVTGVKQYIEAVEQGVKQDCDNCDKLDKQYNDGFDSGFDAGFEDAKKEDNAEIETLKSDLAAAEETIKISADCSNCTEKSELAQALLQISDLKTEIEELQASPSPAVDCGNCEKMAETDRTRAEMQAEIERLTAHKENLQGKCDRLQGELETARAESGSIGKEDIERLSSLDAERKEWQRERERIESALEQSRNSLRTETERAERAESERDTILKKHKTEIETLNHNHKTQINDIKSTHKKWDYLNVVLGVAIGWAIAAAVALTAYVMQS